MNGINVGRWLAGGLAAGIVIWILEGLSSALLYMDAMQAAHDAHGLSMELGASTVVLTVVVSLITGITMIFFYAAIRPRFGPGPKTAVIVAVGLWVGGYLLSLIGYYLLGLYPVGLLVLWGVTGLIEMILAAVLGAWIYREPQVTPAPGPM